MLIFETTDIVTLIEELGGFLLFLLFIIGISIKIIKNYLEKAITIKAKIIDKIATTYNAVSKIPFPGTITDNIIVFYANGKTLRFKTSIWLYDSVKKGETGILKYKGNKFISFR